MSVYAAFLRAMNVGGRRLTNELLRSHIDELGRAAACATRRST
ncbi:MAG: DUF1697 domain-containing protein [Solirubrobacterales bacterium]|nr:DUF1697 domain-containing protein [Solirubrobacterales bacterium]